ncbi:hypothetical protein PJP10_31715, partial [Mycobacterium kansasii]
MTSSVGNSRTFNKKRFFFSPLILASPYVGLSVYVVCNDPHISLFLYIDQPTSWSSTDIHDTVVIFFDEIGSKHPFWINVWNNQ